MGNPTGSRVAYAAPDFYPAQVKWREFISLLGGAAAAALLVAARLADKWRRLSRAGPYPVLLDFREYTSLIFFCRSHSERASEKRRQFIPQAARLSSQAAFDAADRCALAVVNGAQRRKIRVAPRRGVVVAAQLRRCMYNVACSSGAVREETMSKPSPTTYRFNARNNRSVRLRIEAARMRTGIVVLAQLFLCGNALAAMEYAVDGSAIGTQLDFDSASYREYKCNPSDQFEGFIWCQKSRTEKERRGSYIVGHSLLRSQDGRISYINRSQEPAFLNPKKAELNIEGYSRKFGDSPRIMKMPHRSGLPDGVIAVWGGVTLEPLDLESIKTLADGKNPKKGFLVDYLRNFTRSAKEGLPIYRIGGGPGFIWAATFDQKGRGTLRLAAVNVSGFSPSPAAIAAVEISGFSAPPAPVAAVEGSGFSAPPAQVAAVEGSGFSAPPAPVAATKGSGFSRPPVAVQTAASTQELPPKLNQTIEKLQAELAISTNKIAELERAKSDAERAFEEAEHAKRDAEKAKQEVDQTRVAEKTASDALISQLRADKVAAGAKTSRWEIGLYGSIGGVLVVLASSGIGFLINGRSASVSKKPVEKPRKKPIEVSPSTLSPGSAISEAALERDLEQAVAGINGVPAALGTDRRYESI